MTETKVFQTVAQTIGMPRGAAILPMVHTGDFEGDNAELAIEIYRRLTQSGALLPPTIAIVFDDEGRTVQAKAEIRKRLEDTRVEFLPFRMIENLFLDPELICAFLERTEPQWGPRSRDFSPDAIAQLWNTFSSGNYKVNIERATDVHHWTTQVHGARVLAATLDKFTDHRFRFDKVAHGHLLTKLASDLNPELLAPIKTLLRELMAATTSILQ